MSDTIIAIIFVLEGLALAVIVGFVIHFALKRRKAKKEETFEQRDN